MRELYAPQDSLIHRMDPRVKVILTLAFIFALSLTPAQAWPAYILFFTCALAVILLSRLGIGFVLKRALLAVPFVLAALPLVFFGPLPRFPIFAGSWIMISPAGLARFASIAVKSWISLQAAIILTSTTRVPDLLQALRQLKVPRLFVAIIGLMWRYLFVMGEEVTRMMRARNSRSAVLPGSRHSGGSLIWRAGVTGGMAGSLLLRSLERSDRVYAAMLSRGYNGEPPEIDSKPISARDRRVMWFGFFLLAGLWILGLVTGA